MRRIRWRRLNQVLNTLALATLVTDDDLTVQIILIISAGKYI